LLLEFWVGLQEECITLDLPQKKVLTKVGD
jgi:hypothetical protein